MDQEVTTFFDYRTINGFDADRSRKICESSPGESNPSFRGKPPKKTPKNQEHQGYKSYAKNNPGIPKNARGISSCEELRRLIKSFVELCDFIHGHQKDAKGKIGPGASSLAVGSADQPEEECGSDQQKRGEECGDVGFAIEVKERDQSLGGGVAEKEADELHRDAHANKRQGRPGQDVEGLRRRDCSPRFMSLFEHPFAF